MKKSGQIYIRFIGLYEDNVNADKDKIVAFLEKELKSKVDKVNVVITFPKPEKSALLEFKSETLTFDEAKAIYDACFGKDYCDHKLAAQALNLFNKTIIKGDGEAKQN